MPLKANALPWLFSFIQMHIVVLLIVVCLFSVQSLLTFKIQKRKPSILLEVYYSHPHLHSPFSALSCVGLFSMAMQKVQSLLRDGEKGLKHKQHTHSTCIACSTEHEHFAGSQVKACLNTMEVKSTICSPKVAHRACSLVSRLKVFCSFAHKCLCIFPECLVMLPVR